jgi:hypothetical protein
MFLLRASSIIVFLTISVGCMPVNQCASAKSDVKKYFKVYMEEIRNGEKGASVKGGAESIAALELAKVNCNNNDLTIEIIINEAE